MANDGFHLLPLQPKGKEPEFSLLLGNSTKPYQENQAGPEVVKSWLNSKQDINIGCFAGTELDEDYRLIIVDLDQETPKGFGFPVTPIVETNRGYHLYFKCHKDKIPAAHKGPRGEIKTNGYVVAPPSLHPSGIYYQWSEYLSFQDVPLADFDTRRDQIINYLESGECQDEGNNKVKAKEAERGSNTTNNIISSVKGEDLTKKYREIDCDRNLLLSLGKEEEVAIHIMKNIFDTEVKRLGSAFICPLHKEDNPSASLYQLDDGVIALKDFHSNNDKGGLYTFPELYYEFRTGNYKELSSGTSVIWWARLLKDSKLIKLPSIIPPKNLKCLSNNEEKLYLSFIELLEVQLAYNSEQRPAPFSHRFAAAWSGLPLSSVRSAKKGLLRKGYLFKSETGDRATRKAAKWSIYEKDKLDHEK